MLSSVLSEALYIVGIGASAGGLDNMLSLFSKLKANGRITYVVAQHMAHDAHSELIVRLLNRESALPVSLAERSQTLQADNIYLIPAGFNGELNGDELLLRLPDENSLSIPSVNVLFDSLAKSVHERAVGIVLSGTGRDGSSGCLAVKASGGRTIALDPDSTKFNGMPSSAIEAKAITEVLSIENIADRLNQSFSLGVRPPDLAAVAMGDVEIAFADLQKLLRMILDATATDFSGYKEETLLRRLHKRLSLLGLSTVPAYFEHILRHPNELHTLQHLFLVSLSSFFRDKESFSKLEEAIAALINTKKKGDVIRFWVAGCASGEEVFTLAIILMERLGKRLNDFNVSIVGTDINPEALDMAQRGIYRQTAFREMKPVLLRRYFKEKGHHYQVDASVQALCRFELQNLIQVPVLSELDLISCRNLLIYLKSDLQDRIFHNFHQALRPHGLLFVGQAESIGMIGNTLFYPVDHYHKIYQRRP